MNSADYLIDGYITHLRPYFEQDMSRCYLEVFGMDASVLMNVEEKIVAWDNQKDSDIAQQIFTSYGFSSEIEDTGIAYDENIATIMQRETDIHFLKRLAQRNAFECFVKGGKGYFRTPRLETAPQKVLAVHFGENTNLLEFRVEVDGTKATVVEMNRYNPLEKTVEAKIFNQSDQRTLGLEKAADMRGFGVPQTKQFPKEMPSYNLTEMERFCRSVYDGDDWFVKAQGAVDGLVYGEVLRAKRLVTIKGVSKTYSGVYYITKVTHYFTMDTYTQRFEAKRNALTVDGTEDFGEDSALSNGYLGDLVGTGQTPERTEIREDGSQVAPRTQSHTTVD